MLRYYAHPSTTPLAGTNYFPSIEIGASKYLAGGFDFRTQLSVAPNVSFPLSGERFVSGPMIDMNYLLAFKFNNGVFFRESALIGPYLLFGVGGSYVENNPDVYLPLGGGLNVRINPRMSMRVETVRKISVNKEPQNLAHALAFIYNLGSGSEIPPGTLPQEIEEELVAASLMPRDSDLDGIVDHEDDCPNHPGSVQFLGCPSSNQTGEDAFALDESDISDAELELDADEGDAMASQDEMSFDAMSELGLLAEETPSPAQIEPETKVASKPAKLASHQPQAKPKKPTPKPTPEPVHAPPIKEVTTYAAAPVQASPSPKPPVQAQPEPQPEPMPEQQVSSSSPAPIASASPSPASPQRLSPCSQQPLPDNQAPILFSYGSHELQGTAKDQLKELAELMQSCDEIKLVLEGHTDDIGTENDNLVLSIMRAFNVKYHLVYEYGISQSRISSKGLGEIAASSQSSSREKNRRVEYSFVL